MECIKELRKYLTEKTHKKLESLFNDASNQIGFLLNERFINIPPQVAVPLLESLWYNILKFLLMLMRTYLIIKQGN